MGVWVEWIVDEGENNEKDENDDAAGEFQSVDVY
jgi:hypothetical protein